MAFYSTVTKSEIDKGKLHQVFERSFDCKEITSQYFFTQKLSYIHNNPCSSAWKLVENPVDYVHSSAKFYLTGEQSIYLIADQLLCAAATRKAFRETRQWINEN